MEVSVPILLLLFSLLWVFSFPIFRKLFLRNYAESQERLPPGKMGWPFLGESLDFYSNYRQGVLEKFVTDRSSMYSSKIFRTSMIGQPMAVLCGAEGNKFLFTNEKKLVQHWWPSSVDKIFPNSNDTNAKNGQIRRRFIASVLKGDALREYVGIMDATIKHQLQTNWSCKKVIKVGDEARRYTFALACRIFLGINDPKRINEFEDCIKIIATGLHSIPVDLPGTALHRAIKVSKKMRREIEHMIRKRKVELLRDNGEVLSPAKDMVSHMLLAKDDNGELINEVDMACHLGGLLEAGYANVHSTIANVMKYLAEFPQIYNLVLREQKEIARSMEPKGKLSWEDVRKMKYSWNVACEVLRLLPPGFGGFKEAVTDLSYEGYTIPRGWKMHWSASATHKNPEYFPEPEKFDPSRFEGDGPASYTFVPFGGGARMCPGNEYAKIAILIFLHNVSTKFRWEKMIPDEEVIHDPLPRPSHGLPVYLYPHN